MSFFSVKSFEVSVDSDSNSCLPSGAALLHIYKQRACLTSRTPPIQVFHEWSLAEPLAQFQWERHGFHIVDLNQPTQHCFLYTKSQDDIQRIKREVDNKFEWLNHIDDETAPVIPRNQRTNSCNDNSPNDSSVPLRRKSASIPPVKEDVKIRFPDKGPARRCNSDTVITKSSKENVKLFKSNSFDSRNDKNRSHEMHVLPYDNTILSKDNIDKEQKDMNASQINTNSEIISQENKNSEIMDKMPDLRPKVYMYMNAMSSVEHQMSNNYVNIFSGSTFKGCYENWQQQSSIYTRMQEMIPPIIPPRRRQQPPKLPPRRHQLSYYNSLQCPPPLPPRPKSPNTKVSAPSNSCAPRIQVALFADIPVSGRVWFLRVAFMHQDENDTTFKVIIVKTIRLFKRAFLIHRTKSKNVGEN